VEYYNTNCDRILSQASALNSAGDLEKALGVLSNVPEEVPCYERIKAKAIEVYKAYVNQLCKQQLNEANSLIAKQDYNGALKVLASIDPSSSCNQDAKTAISKVEGKVSEQQRQDYKERMERYNNSVELEKERIRAVRDIATAYYNRTQPTYNYLMIIK
jgi:thioredoxin-like negative regulator of GroEL